MSGMEAVRDQRKNETPKRRHSVFRRISNIGRVRSWLSDAKRPRTMWANDKNCISARITVMGCCGVGKTALVVRYLTKRYIGDYISGTDISYKCELSFMRRQVEVQIQDTSGVTSKDSVLDMAKLCKTDNDVLMLVYALNDVSSFHFIEDMLSEISDIAPRASILVVGNKSDLNQSSTFFESGIKKLTMLYTFTHMTVSAKSSCSDASNIFLKSIALVMKKRTFEKSASSADLTIYDADKFSQHNHEFKVSQALRRRRSGGSGTKLVRRATVDCGITMARSERRPSERLPSVEDTIEEEVEERCTEYESSARRGSSATSLSPSSSFSSKKRKKVPPSSINLSRVTRETTPSNSLEPQSAPLPSNRMPVFRFPEVSCAAEYRYASLPTSPDNLLKRQNSFLNKIKGAFTAVPQKLRSPK